jgi:hypothetical protein
VINGCQGSRSVDITNAAFVGHCEERSDEAIQSSFPKAARLRVAPPGNLFELLSRGTEDWIASLRSQ